MNFAAATAPGLPPVPAASRPGVRTGKAGPRQALLAFHNELSRALGPQHWWPARTRFEVVVGAILTQSTAWTNVERAIRNLRRAGMLSPRAIERVSRAQLERLVRPAGYFRQKARKLKAFTRFLGKNFSGSLSRMLRTPTEQLRAMLLAVHGIGPETADSILLYAGNHRVFVVDAYTRRILARHGLSDEKASYEELRALFEQNVPRDPRLYNEFHAQLVMVGKNWCRRQAPRCDACPLGRFLESRP